MKKTINPIIRLTVILLLVTALTSGVLGLTNYVTKDRIAEQKRLATEAAYKEVLPCDAGYEEVSFDTAAFPSVDKISAAKDGAGHVAELTFSGAQGMITAAVGVGADGSIKGVSIISHSETAGLGAKAVEPEFRNQYANTSDYVALTKNGGTINAISGATITSAAVTSAVNTARDAVESLGQGGAKG